MTVLSAMVLFIGCEKEEIDLKTNLLTNNTWDIYNVTGNGVDITNTSVNPFYDCTCDFYKDGIYIITNGGSYEGSWGFDANQTSLIFDEGTADEMLMTILELSENRLELQFLMTMEGEALILIIKAKPV